MVTKTQIFFNNKKDTEFDSLNVHDIAMHSFELNDEIVSPQLTESQFNEFMSNNPKCEINNLGQLVKNGLVYGTVLEYIK